MIANMITIIIAILLVVMWPVVQTYLSSTK